MIQLKITQDFRCTRPDDAPMCTVRNPNTLNLEFFIFIDAEEPSDADNLS